MIGVIARRELRSMFVSPLGWVILAVVAFILSYIFMGMLAEYLEKEKTTVSSLIGHAHDS